jgi:hypothetical protein
MPRNHKLSRRSLAIWNNLNPGEQFLLLNYIAQNGRKWKYNLKKLWNGPKTIECLRHLCLRRKLTDEHLYEIHLPKAGGVQKDYFSIIGGAEHVESSKNFFSRPGKNAILAVMNRNIQ